MNIFESENIDENQSQENENEQNNNQNNEKFSKVFIVKK